MDDAAEIEYLIEQPQVIHLHSLTSNAVTDYIKADLNDAQLIQPMR